MSGARRIYELLGANEPKFQWATFRDGKIDTGDHVFVLDKYLARGKLWHGVRYKNLCHQD